MIVSRPMGIHCGRGFPAHHPTGHKYPVTCNGSLGRKKQSLFFSRRPLTPTCVMLITKIIGCCTLKPMLWPFCTSEQKPSVVDLWTSIIAHCQSCDSIDKCDILPLSPACRTTSRMPPQALIRTCDLGARTWAQHPPSPCDVDFVQLCISRRIRLTSSGSFCVRTRAETLSHHSVFFLQEFQGPHILQIYLPITPCHLAL